MAKDHKPDLAAITKAIFPNLPDREQVTAFYEAVGLALSAWQLVEDALYKLFERALEPRRPGAAGCGFHTIESFRAKLGVTDSAVRFSFLSAKTEQERKALKEEWETLFEKARNKSMARNALAHFQSFTYFDEEKKDKRIRLTPHLHDYRSAVGIVVRKEYTLNDLRNHAGAFRKLANDLRAFLSKIPPVPQRQRSASS